MDEKSESKSQDDSQKSLIPAIRAEETRLQEMLAEAESQTGASIEQARREAAEFVETTRRLLPEWIAMQRDSQLGQIRAKARQLCDSRPERIEAMQETAGRNMATAVDRILAAVWEIPE